MDVERSLPSAGRLRSTPEGPAEAALAASFERRRRAALDRTRRAFGGFDFEAVAATTDGASFALLDVDPQLAEDLAAEAAWVRYFQTQDGVSPRFAVVPSSSGEPVHAGAELIRPPLDDAELPTPIPGAVVDALRQGSTVILNRLDQWSTGPLRALSEDLDACFGIVATCNCYLSRGAARGFGRHWDDHDVLIVQVEGRKLWEVFEPTHLSPHRNYVPEDIAGRASWSGILEPGRALHIPRGWAHRVVSLDEVSVHYTIAIQRPTFLDLLGMCHPPAGPADPAALEAWLAAQLAEGTEATEQARAAYRAEVPTRPRCDPLAIDRWLDAPAPDGLEVLHANGGASFLDLDRGVGLRWSGADVSLSDEEAAILAAWPLPGDAPVSLPGGADAAERLGRSLLQHGLARPIATSR